MHVMCVAGARPNYMKIKPVMAALEARDAQVTLVHTGQHYDREMNDVFFEDLGIRTPDACLGVGSGSHADQTARVMTLFEPLVAELSPDAVVVVGDVNSTLACALVTAKHGALLAHVEAGLRSRDWSMPEEVNRVVTDRISDLLLAPSPDAVDNLLAEGHRPDQIALVGNVMADTLLTNLDRAGRSDVHARLGVLRRGYALATLHRPANVDDDAVLAGLLRMLGVLARTLPVVFPAHPRTAARIDRLGGAPDGVVLCRPQGYLDFVALQGGARVVLTDSGGVQEETTILGVPCLTVRDNTERPITITEGTNRLVGREPGHVLAAAIAALDDVPASRRPALWDGRAGERIADRLVSALSGTRLRPGELERVQADAA